MTPAYIAQLSLKVQKIDVNAQKIDWFLLANISMEMVLGMPFLTFSNVDV